MSDYISRKAALAALQDPELFNVSPIFLKIIRDLPDADVEPVRRVTPIRCGMDEYYGEWVRCPNCDFDLNTSAAKFCGGCGAKMDLGEDSFEV